MAVDARTTFGDTPPLSNRAPGDRDAARLAAKATAAAIAVGAIGFGLWEVRSIVILLLLALTFAAAIRPGVEWLNDHRVPQPAAIFAFFFAVGAIVVLFFWAAVPPALHQIQEALDQRVKNGPPPTPRQRRLLTSRAR